MREWYVEVCIRDNRYRIAEVYEWVSQQFIAIPLTFEEALNTLAHLARPSTAPRDYRIVNLSTGEIIPSAIF